METRYSSESSVGFQRTTRCYIPEGRIHDHRCENLKTLQQPEILTTLLTVEMVCGDCCLLGCDDVQPGRSLTSFWRHLLPSSSERRIRLMEGL
jgi:hypothetical protein